MSESIHNAVLFLIETLFDLYIIILIIRVILVWIRADYFNPIVQFVTKLTDFAIKPLRRLIPNIQRIETVSIVLIVMLLICKFYLLALISFGIPNIIGIFILTIADIIKLFIQTFFYAIILQALLSWIQPYSPMNYILLRFTSPIMRPIQRVIPPVGGIDITPIPALILLQLLSIMLVPPLTTMGWSMAIRGYF